MKEIEIYGDYIQLDQFLKKENMLVLPIAAYLTILAALLLIEINYYYKHPLL